MVQPKCDGTFSFDIAFKEASDKRKNRIYCADFGSDTDIDKLDLSTLQKGSYTTIGSDITSTNVNERTVDMSAGHTYIIYTYQTGSTISDMKYMYKDNSVTPTPIISPTVIPTVTPTPTVSPKITPTASPEITPTVTPVVEVIDILGKSVNEDKAEYLLRINAGNNAKVIAAVYNEDGSLYAVKLAEVNDNSTEISVDIADNTKVKFMLWDSFSRMKPLSYVVTDKF